MSPAAGPIMGPVVVAEVVRSGFVEGHHHGSVVAVEADGSVSWSMGDVDSPILPRSVNKPLQALGMLQLGLDLPPELLALVCASHSGEAVHQIAVQEILAGAGLDDNALLCPPSLPLEDRVLHEWLRAGGEPLPILMDCSGKHAGMLATCVVNGWDAADYTSPEHPLQVALRESFAAYVDTQVTQVATDGCGAPIFPASLTQLARAFSRLATAADGDERRIADAIRSFPERVSGTTRDECELLRAIPGAIGKSGAESVYVVAVPDGRAVALKIDDGGDRARRAVMAAALGRLGFDTADVRRTGECVLLGGGRPVGEVRAVPLP